MNSWIPKKIYHQPTHPRQPGQTILMKSSDQVQKGDDRFSRDIGGVGQLPVRRGCVTFLCVAEAAKSIIGIFTSVRII
jgi:hypothetical protein